MSIDAGRRAPAARRPRRLGPGWVPREHGAWAMLVVPVVVGSIIGGPTWRHALLLLTWLVGFCAFSAAGLWLRSGRRARYVPPLRFHAIASGVLGVVLLAGAPGVLRWAPVFAVACVMTVVSAGLRGGWGGSWMPPGADEPRAWVAAMLLAGYFVGTVPYVKTLIRDRGNRRVLAVSVGYHAALAAASLVWLTSAVVARSGVWTAGALASVALGLLARAVLVPRRRPWPSPKAIGFGEIAASVIVTVVVLVAVR